MSTGTIDILAAATANIEADGGTIDTTDRVVVITEEGREITAPRVVVEDSGEFITCEACGGFYVSDLRPTPNCTSADFCEACNEVCHKSCWEYVD